MDDNNPSKKILQSWNANAGNWISTIDGNEIESRKLVTNAAIVDVVVKYQPKRVLDVGCGEGWLTRALQAQGIDTIGMDATENLIANAIEKGGDFYRVCSYEELVRNENRLLDDCDAVVINFALLDKTASEQLIIYLGKHLQRSGHIFIQTLHPFSIASTDGYESGWKEGSWNGLGNQYTHAYSWYFRTLKDWIELFTKAGLTLKELQEPMHPETHKPASVIFVLRVG